LTAVIEETTTITQGPKILHQNNWRNNQAQSGVSSSLSRLLVTVEAYPRLKANQFS
jgi:LemA protein